MIKKEPIAGNFEPDSLLMWQLQKLNTEELTKKWWKEYLEYHNGVDQGVKYSIGYFANESHRNNLYKWLA
jgi:hypothetical protein